MKKKDREKVPPRARRCAATQKNFQPGETVVSLLQEGREESIRQDYSQEGWQNQTPPSRAILWYGKIPERKLTFKEQLAARLDKAYELFCQFYQKEEKLAYILALFLVRHKRLVVRGDNWKKCECAQSGEIFSLSQIELPQEEVLELQVKIAELLNGVT